MGGKGETRVYGWDPGFCPLTQDQVKSLGPELGFPQCARCWGPFGFRYGVPSCCGDVWGWQGRRKLGEADGDRPWWWQQGLSWLHFWGLWVFLLAGMGSSGLCATGGLARHAVQVVGMGRRASLTMGWSLLLHFPGGAINNVQPHQKLKEPFFFARGDATRAVCAPLPSCHHPPAPARSSPSN